LDTTGRLCLLLRQDGATGEATTELNNRKEDVVNVCKQRMGGPTATTSGAVKAITYTNTGEHHQDRITSGSMEIPEGITHPVASGDKRRQTAWKEGAKKKTGGNKQKYKKLIRDQNRKKIKTTRSSAEVTLTRIHSTHANQCPRWRCWTSLRYSLPKADVPRLAGPHQERWTIGSPCPT